MGCLVHGKIPLRQNLSNLWTVNRRDAVLTERYDSADVVVETEVDINKETEISTEKYQFVQYNAGMRVIVKGIADDKVLTEYIIKDFKITLPASRSEAQVRQSVLREMGRQMNRELPKFVKEFKFDKREIVWRQLTSVSK